ncbi:MAG: carboxypeptidase-like regulatory domain-containing protein [Bacteroidota bacterium]
MLKSLFTIILLLFLIAVNAQTVLKGTVTDENNTPVKDANVLLVGTSKGASTDATGNYSITAGIPKTYFVAISHIEYGSQIKEITLREGDNTLDFILSKTSNQLEEVVISGSNSRLENLQLMAALVSMVNNKENAWLKRNERNEWNGIAPNFRSFDHSFERRIILFELLSTLPIKLTIAYLPTNPCLTLL